MSAYLVYRRLFDGYLLTSSVFHHLNYRQRHRNVMDNFVTQISSISNLNSSSELKTDTCIDVSYFYFTCTILAMSILGYLGICIKDLFKKPIPIALTISALPVGEAYVIQPQLYHSEQFGFCIFVIAFLIGILSCYITTVIYTDYAKHKKYDDDMKRSQEFVDYIKRHAHMVRMRKQMQLDSLVKKQAYFGETFESETIKGVAEFEKTLMIINIFKMIVETYVYEHNAFIKSDVTHRKAHISHPECDHNDSPCCQAPDNRWFSLSKSWKMMTLIDSLFTIAIGKPIVALLLSGDIEKEFKGLELFAVQYCATMFVHGKGVANAGERFFREQQHYKYKPESLEFLETVHEMSTDYMSLVNSQFGKKLVGLCSLLICVPALNHLGLTPSKFNFNEDMEKALRFDYSKISAIALPGIIIESSSFVAIKLTNMFLAVKKFGYEQGLKTLFVTQSDFAAFDKEYMWLRRNHKNFSCSTETVNFDGSPDPFTLEGYFIRCEKAIELCDKIMPALKTDPYAKNRLERSKYDILNFQSDCSAEMRAGESRPFPYAIMLTGPPSVGKSMIKDICFNQMYATDNASGRFELPYDPKFVYTYNPTDDFYSGFKTSHTSILLDDVAQKNPQILVANAGDDLNDLIRIINSIPFLPNQAELEKKGKTPMRVRYVIGTTNTPDLSAHHVFSCPSAVYRRMLFINCSVKKQFQDDYGVGLRGDKVDPTNLDLWQFTIDKYFPDGQRGFKMSWNGTDWDREGVSVNIQQLSHFIKNDLNTHWAKQEKAKKAYENLISLGTCPHGIARAICTECKSTGETLAASYNAVCGVLAMPVYMLLAVGYIHVKMFPKSAISKPVWAFRYALYLAQWLPDAESTRKLRLFQYCPPRLANYMCKNHVYTLYDEMAMVSDDMYKWYQRDVLESWRFPAIASLLAVMFTLVLSYKFLNKNNNYKAEALSDDTHHKYPVASSEDLVRKNNWLKQNKLGVFPSSGSTISEYDINNQCMLNNVRIHVIHKSGRDWIGNALIVCANLFVTAAHSIHDLDNDPPVTIRVDRLTKAGDISTIRFPVDSSSWVIDQSQDLVWFKSNRILPGRDLTKFMRSNKEPVHINCPGIIHYKTIDPASESKAINLTRVTTAIPCQPYFTKLGPQSVIDCVQAYGPASFDGLCGAPVLAFQGHNKMLVGIHTAGDKHSGFTIRSIYVETVQDILKRMSIHVVNDNEQDLAYCAETKATEIITVHEKCPSAELKDGECIVIGGSCLPRARFHTDVKRSPIYRDVYNFFSQGNEYFDIPWDSPKQCDPKAAILLSMEKAVQNANFLPSEIDFAVKCFSKQILSKFSRERLERLHPYPWAVAVNGCDGIPYLERINLSTSGGHGHPGPKRKLFDLGPTTEYHIINYEMDDVLWDEVKWIHDQYMLSKEANPVFKCSFKDEPISMEKIRQNKVRIFSGSPTAFSIVTRKYLLSIIREMVGVHRLDFEMAIGANAHGMDWDEIYHHVIRHGVDRCFAGDYKAFDKQMAPEMILAGFEVIFNILRASGNYSEDDFKILYGIAYDTAFPVMDMFGTYVQFFGSNPSGHVLTTPINSLVNSLYMRMAVKRILPNLDDSFYENFESLMSLVTYGDDNCGTTTSQFPELNHTSIQRVLAEAGIIYTSDDKSVATKGLVGVENITFLKRKFIYDLTLKRMVAPLLEESLIKALSVWTYSRQISVKEQLAAVIDSVNREYFFYGSDRFKIMNTFLNMLVEKHDVAIYLPGMHLASYKEIYQQLIIC